MSKWINRYLNEFHTDKTDINDNSHDMSVLSVSTISVSNKNEININNMAGDLTTSNSDNNFKINKKSISHTDNTDNSWNVSSLIKFTPIEKNPLDIACKYFGC